MLDNSIMIPKGRPLVIGVRFIAIGSAGDDFFCTTYLGYGGENFRHIPHNEECAFEVVNTPECTKGETDYCFGQIPRIHYFDA